MLYMYILGWEVDFGHVEAVNLIAGNKYTEKQIVRWARARALAPRTVWLWRQRLSVPRPARWRTVLPELARATSR